ncbi:hypothetical protein GA0116948_104293 [Chitinophaga costaii]|uniref:Uncharacterized protein n=1 Tax=Chitinophaga costaii TaxID=1335309 RepID=A0A1C4CTR0_9BACT|nr:hypothetical protein GA0116948_104293 [Chitinophaga costaii]
MFSCFCFFADLFKVAIPDFGAIVEVPVAHTVVFKGGVYFEVQAAEAALLGQGESAMLYDKFSERIYTTSPAFFLVGQAMVVFHYFPQLAVSAPNE